MSCLLKRFFIVVFVIAGGLSRSNADEFKVGITHWPPFRIYAEQDVQGIDVDIWNEIGKRLKLEIVFSRCPWARCLFKMKEGSLDGLVSLAYREDRAEYVLYTHPPVYALTTVFYVKKGNAHILRKYEDLYDLKVGYVNKSAYFDPFNDDTNIRKFGVVKEIQLIEMLAANRLDAFIGTDPQVAYQIRETKHSDKLEKAQYKPGNELPLFLGVSKASPYAKNIDAINQAIQSMLDEGFVDHVFKKWVSN